MRRLLVLVIAALLTVPLQAQDKQKADSQPPTEATKKMKDSLEQPTPVEDGAKQPPGGKAEPEENWFGCKPDEEEQQEGCDERNNTERHTDDAS